MIYLDYSATTPVCVAALEAIKDACAFVGNPNSTHSQGRKIREQIEECGNRILASLNVPGDDIIYTSGATEANNLAIRGCFEGLTKKRERTAYHIITTEFEHPSVLEPIKALEEHGVTYEFIKCSRAGKIDIEELKKMIGDREDTFLVSIGSVNSETGVRQPIKEIGKQLKENFPKVIFHTDASQAAGRLKIDFSNVDMVTFTAHKFYGMKGIGALVKKKNVDIEPMILGGSSLSPYRSGTPSTELIAAMAAALDDTFSNLNQKQAKIKYLNSYLRAKLSGLENVVINSPSDAVSHIFNFSIMGTESSRIQQMMEEKGIIISTRTACDSNVPVSRAVMNLTGSEERAKSSVRVSLSYMTTQEELDAFVAVIKEWVSLCQLVQLL